MAKNRKVCGACSHRAQYHTADDTCLICFACKGWKPSGPKKRRSVHASSAGLPTLGKRK